MGFLKLAIKAMIIHAKKKSRTELTTLSGEQGSLTVSREAF